VTTASVERKGRDVIGLIAIVAGAVLFVVAITVYLHSGKAVLPF
jgi:hypothetical protein